MPSNGAGNVLANKAVKYLAMAKQARMMALLIRYFMIVNNCE